MYQTVCSVEGCETYHYSKGYCAKHYGRFMRHGDATHAVARDVAAPGEVRMCSVDDCTEAYSSKGLCHRHYMRQYSYGDLNIKNRGKTKIFGENRTKHPLYKVYHNMVSRCYHPRHQYYSYYGGRGIKVDDHWLGPQGFPHFIEDMGERPKGYTVERINNDGDYSPTNCRWASRKEQRANTRMQSNNSSGHVGVHLYKATGKWSAYVTVNGKRKHLGYYKTMQEAITAREEHSII